jgi:flagellar biosynthesis protein FlhB
LLLPFLKMPLLALFAIAGAAALGATVAYVVQTKGGFWPDEALPDISRAFSPESLTKIFSKDTAVDLLLDLVKVLTLGYVMWRCLRGEFLTLPRLLDTRPEIALGLLFKPLGAAAVKVVTVMALWAGVDLAVTQLRFRKKLRMSKDEIRREMKDEDGDPSFKGRRRRKHRELLKGLARIEVPKADALLVNPTHVAIAIRYRSVEDKAPRVTAKGKGELAEYMRDLARENGIPIVENIPLARLLFRKVKIGRCVPADTYKAVAAILAYVYRITGRKPGSGRADDKPQRTKAPRQPAANPGADQ